MKGLIFVSMLAVALGCLATAEAQEPAPATVAAPPVYQQPTLAQPQQYAQAPQVMYLAPPQSRVVCQGGNCQQQQAMRPQGGYVFTRGFFPWRVQYRAWSR